MKAKFIILVLFCFSAVSCNNKTEIIQLNGLTKFYSFQNEKAEHFVVANPPENNDSLLSLISRHLQSFASDDTIENYYYYSHFYFKETRFTPRDYREEWNGYFDHDYIDSHSEDLLINLIIEPENNRREIVFYEKGKRTKEIRLPWKEGEKDHD